MTTTLDLPQDIVSQAEELAAARKTTLEALVIEGLRSVLRTTPTDPAIANQALGRLREGFHLGGGKALTRDQAHAR
jgi:hypothetical protein